MKSFLALLCLSQILISCDNPNETEKTKKGEVDSIYIYRFEDGSMAPEYHRSYTIKITPQQVYLSINSYDDILFRDTSNLSNADYIDFLLTISMVDIRTKKKSKEDDCTGGTTHELEMYSGKARKLIKGYRYNCGGGEPYGNLEGDVEAAVKVFKNMVPDLAGKIEATRRNNK